MQGLIPLYMIWHPSLRAERADLQSMVAGCRESDFVLSDDKVGDYYTGCRRVLTNIFGAREVMAYVTSTEKKRHRKAVFQDCFSCTAADLLCMAGESTT